MPEKIPIVHQLQAETTKLAKDLDRAKSQLSKYQKTTNRLSFAIQRSMANAFGIYTLINGARGAVKSLADFEKQISKVRAITGATDKELDSLKQNALDLGANSKYTATQIGKMQEELARLGFTTPRIIAASDAVRKLATVADSELGEAAKTMAGSLNSFNLEATESDRVANVMAESFSKSALDLEKFTVATANSGAIARTFGITIEKNTARIGALVDANIDASKAGTDLRKIYLELNKAGLTYEQAMNQIRESSDQAGTAQKLFGDRAAGAAVILATSQEKVRGLTAALSDNNTEINTMVDAMEDNLISDWQKFTSAIDGAIQKGSGLVTVLRDITKGATAVVQLLSGNYFTSDTNQFQILDEAEQTLARLIRLDETLQKKSKGVSLNNVVGIKDNTQLNSIVEDIEKITKGFKELSTLDTTLFSEETNGIIKSQVSSLEYVSDLLDKQNIKENLKLSLQEKITQTIERANAALENQNKIKAETPEGGKSSTYIAPTGVIVPQIDLSSAIENALSDIDMEALTATLSDNSIADAMFEGLAPNPEEIAEEWDYANDLMYQKMEETKEQYKQQLEELNNIINDTLANGVIAMTESLFTGGLEHLFDNLGKILAEGMSMMGKSLIAMGFAEMAFLKSFDPATKIAAGVALVGLSSAFKAATASTNAGAAGALGSGSGGGTGAYQTSAIGGSQINVNVTGRLEGEGRSIAGVLDHQTQLDARHKAARD